MKTLKNPFDLEALRHKLASKKDLKSFKNTYSSKYPEIKDLNSSGLWDYLNNRYHIENSDSPMTAHKIKIISKFVPNAKKQVLNIGCGSGDLENIVFNKQKKFNLKWQGIDISHKSIKSCQKEFTNANFGLGDIRKLQFKPNTFDFVILMEILEHIKPKEIFKALSEVGRVIKKNGTLIVSVPLNEGLSEMLTRGENPNAHVRAYTEEIIKTELLLSGFEVKKVITLFAFNKLYWIKTFVAKYFLSEIKRPNNLILFCKKN